MHLLIGAKPGLPNTFFSLVKKRLCSPELKHCLNVYSAVLCTLGSLTLGHHLLEKSVLPFDHHPGTCHGDRVTFPVIPVDSFSLFSTAIDTIQVGIAAVPNASRLLCASEHNELRTYHCHCPLWRRQSGFAK